MKIDSFSDDILGKDELGAIVRGHIHIEQMLNEYINASLLYPEYLKEVDLDFFEKCSIALSCGLDADLKSPLRAIGKLRNKFSHELGTKITTQEANNLYKTFNPNLKKSISIAYEKIRHQSTFTHDKKFRELPANDQVTLMIVTIKAVLEANVLQKGT